MENAASNNVTCKENAANNSLIVVRKMPQATAKLHQLHLYPILVKTYTINESYIKPSIKDLNLQEDAMQILGRDWLNDRHIGAAHQLLKQHGGNGCQTSLLAQTNFQTVSGDTIQILANSNDHWVCSASTKVVVYLANSLGLAPTES